jgi:hypothetical protein
VRISGSIGAIRRFETMPATPTLIRHSDSTPPRSESIRVTGAHACESNGLPSFRQNAYKFSIELVVLEACAGHPNNDFKAWACSYQHFFRQSYARPKPCGFDGIAFCILSACAVGIPIDASVAMQTAKAMNGVCFLIPYLMQ